MSTDRLTNEAISKLVLRERKGKAEYDKLQETFKTDIRKLHASRSIPAVDLLGPHKGLAAAKATLVRLGHSEWFEGDQKNFRGIYVWYHQDRPFYVGISKGVLGRLNQHMKGRAHFDASMAFKIARTLYDEYDGPRADFDPRCEKIYRVQTWLSNQKVAVLPVSDHDQLALFEIYCSMHLKTVLNTFETH